MITSTFSSTDQIEAAIADDGRALIMAALSDAYSRPEEAVLRELISNGIDAQLVNGVTDPIEVTLPDADEHKIVFTDHGIGMTRHQLDNNFSNYGNSLKVGDDAAIGKFGIGAKSIHAVTNQFIVRTTAVGITIEALFSLNERGVPTHMIISEDHTGEPSGTTITIPLPEANHETWIRAAGDLAYYLDEGTVVFTIAGQSHQEDWRTPRPGAVHRDMDSEHSTGQVKRVNNRSRGAVVVMNQIRYQLGSKLTSRYNLDLVFFVNDREIELTHTREYIKESKANIEVLDRYYLQWVAAVYGDMRRESTVSDTLVGIHRASIGADKSLLRETENKLAAMNRRELLPDRTESVRENIEHFIYAAGSRRVTSVYLNVSYLIKLAEHATEELSITDQNDATHTGPKSFLLTVADTVAMHDRKFTARLNAAIANYRKQGGYDPAAGPMCAYLVTVVPLDQLIESRERKFLNPPRAVALANPAEINAIDAEEFIERYLPESGMTVKRSNALFDNALIDHDRKATLRLLHTVADTDRTTVARPALGRGTKKDQYWINSGGRQQFGEDEILTALEDTESKTLVLCDSDDFNCSGEANSIGNRLRSIIGNLNKNPDNPLARHLDDAVWIRRPRRSAARLSRQFPDATVVGARAFIVDAVEQYYRGLDELGRTRLYYARLLSSYRHQSGDPHYGRYITEAAVARFLLNRYTEVLSRSVRELAENNAAMLGVPDYTRTAQINALHSFVAVEQDSVLRPAELIIDRYPLLSELVLNRPVAITVGQISGNPPSCSPCSPELLAMVLEAEGRAAQ